MKGKSSKTKPEAFLDLVRLTAEKHSHTFAPDLFVRLKKIQKAINISAFAEKFFSSEQDEFDDKDFLLAQPRTYSNPVWLEYVYPKTIRLQGIEHLFAKFTRKKVGMYLEWLDNETEAEPQILVVAIVQESDYSTIIAPHYVQIPITLNGCIGETVLYAAEPHVVIFLGDHINEFYGFLLTPMYMAIDSENRRRK